MSYAWTCGLWLIAISAILATLTASMYGAGLATFFVALVNIFGCIPVMVAAQKADAWDKHNRGGIL